MSINGGVKSLQNLSPTASSTSFQDLLRSNSPIETTLSWDFGLHRYEILYFQGILDYNLLSESVSN